MPGRRVVDVDKSLCRRCQVAQPSITVRTEPLCAACFGKYVQSKVVKRMESFRVRNAEVGKEPILLLPLSFGSCSLTLLHILSSRLKNQIERTGRPGFKLHILHVEPNDLVVRLKSLYPEHEYSVKPLHDIASNTAITDLVSSDQSSEILEDLFTQAPTASSKADLLDILLRRFVTSQAASLNCEAILWADSTTGLAERTLSETAKGRGSSLAWIGADGASTYGSNTYYPLKDLLRHEIKAYVQYEGRPLTELLVEEPPKTLSVSAKNTTIDDLMQHFFRSVEQEYPSIVANVVKTSSKLEQKYLGELASSCELCTMPLGGNSPAKSRLCYGCIRTLNQATS
ncbi:hypothetical protein K431DRAFT_340354 [Polychaeton citri CBS 116435]|uniref:Cytoplasmic tRNA 2-thiolation protein 2 n=1 Tax=Polychaeton citri CBS 116435 TaxID=1314669 RepID=A0A9P4ULT9_9PEZI|nr:hypothetical protein K431DRAFT_340354 [Polychaeton citri CBS 116435]